MTRLTYILDVWMYKTKSYFATSFICSNFVYN